MPYVRSQGDLLLALLRGVDIEVWLDDAGQPKASRNDGGRVVADDIFDLKRAGLVVWTGPSPSLQIPQSVSLTPEGRHRAEQLRAPSLS
jgi:hypothetical protein